MSAQPWEPRLAHLEGAFEQFEKRLDDFRGYVTQRFDSVDTRFDRVDDRFDRVDDRFDRLEHKIDVQFRWVVGMMIVAVLAPIAEHVLR
jgi:hypothetical protein